MKEIDIVGQHSEGLTIEQEKLADLFVTTKTQAVVRRRERLSDGSYKLIKVLRETSLIDFDPREGEFAFKLHESNPSALLSQNYINWRNVPENVLDIIGKNLAEVSLKSNPDLCTGIPNAGNDLAKFYSKYSGIPYVEIFTKKQTEREERIVLKNIQAYDFGNLLIIDNVITKATSIFQVLEIMQEVKYRNLELLVGIDREEGGVDKLMNKHIIDFSCLFKFSKLLDYYSRIGKISKEQYDKSKAYMVASNK